MIHPKLNYISNQDKATKHKREEKKKVNKREESKGFCRIHSCNSIQAHVAK
jgi:hypothetical protein